MRHMAEEPTKPAQESAPVTEEAPPAVVATGPKTPERPSPAEDLARLEAMNWFGALLIRLQRGRHPDPSIDALLARRLPIRSHDVGGLFVLRLLNSLAMVFVTCSLAWIAVWAAGTVLGFTAFVQVASGLFVTLLVAVLAITIWQPLPSLDERAVEKAGRLLLEDLKRQVVEEGSHPGENREIPDGQPDEERSETADETLEGELARERSQGPATNEPELPITSEKPSSPSPPASATDVQLQEEPAAGADATAVSDESRHDIAPPE